MRVSVMLATLAILVAPVAPLAWLHASEQLELIARGARQDRGRKILLLAQGAGIAMTMVAVAAAAFGFTVLVVR